VVTSVIGLCVAGVAVVSFEGLDVNESWDIVSPMRQPLSARRCSRIAAENGVVRCCPHIKWWTEAPVRQAMEQRDGVSCMSL
jgi:hypothetical protein